VCHDRELRLDLHMLHNGGARAARANLSGAVLRVLLTPELGVAHLLCGWVPNSASTTQQS